MDRMQTILKLYYEDLFRKDYDENIENKNKWESLPKNFPSYCKYWEVEHAPVLIGDRSSWNEE